MNADDVDQTGLAAMLHEAAALLTDNAGMRLIWAARSLPLQGESA